ncbi:hypothetical protein [Bacillus tianshenii]|nr:hypothetical protein [Bacillus tianshenii]
MNNKMMLEAETKIAGTEKTMLDFWKWGFSNILTNNLRGIFAEYIVGSALGVVNQSRIEWDAFDLVYKGKKIEVKSSAYIQSWHTDRFSKVRFDIGEKKEYYYETYTYSDEPKRHADLYVFCLLKEKDVKLINPIDMTQWEFYVVLTKELDQHFPKQKSISLSSLNKTTQPSNYEQIKIMVDELCI